VQGRQCLLRRDCKIACREGKGRDRGLNRGIPISNGENKITKKRMWAVIMARNTMKTLPKSV
jgi:hypothetical protein